MWMLSKQISKRVNTGMCRCCRVRGGNKCYLVAAQYYLLLLPTCLVALGCRLTCVSWLTHLRHTLCSMRQSAGRWHVHQNQAREHSNTALQLLWLRCCAGKERAQLACSDNGIGCMHGFDVKSATKPLVSTCIDAFSTAS